LAFAKEADSEDRFLICPPIEELIEPANEARRRRLVRESTRDRDWDREFKRVLVRDATASLEIGLLEAAGVRGRDMDGGSDARESRIPAILKRSAPRSFWRERTVERWFEG